MVAPTDIKLYYSEGKATGRPADSSGNYAEKGRRSLGGNPRAAVASNEIPLFNPSPLMNLNALFDDTNERDNEGESGSVIDYRCIYVLNADQLSTKGTQTERDLENTLYRARIYAPRTTSGGVQTVDSSTEFAAACLPISAISGTALTGDSKAVVIADDNIIPQLAAPTAPTLAGGGALTFRDIPTSSTAATQLTLHPDGSTELNLVRDRYLGIWIRRTVDKVEDPEGATEYTPFTVIGGTPVS